MDAPGPLDDEPERDVLAASPSRAGQDVEAGALEDVCGRHPDHAQAIRSRFEKLRKLDLIGGETLDEPPGRLGNFKLLERLGGGDGILLDDVMAGLYGLAVMAILRLFVLEPSSWNWGPLA